MNLEALPAEEFLDEAQELLQEIEDSLLLLEEEPSSYEVIQRLFRSAHTLKGGAAMVGLIDLANEAHEFEAILSKLRSGTLKVSGADSRTRRTCPRMLRESSTMTIDGVISI